MPRLPDPIQHTAAAIDDYWAAQSRQNNDSAGVPISQCTHACDRALWYGLRWASVGEKPSGKRERRFRTGRQYETWLLNDLRAIGCEVEEIDPATGKQFLAELAGGWLRGRADGKATNVPGARKAVHVVECKSLNDRDFKAIAKKGVQEGKPEHYVQTQLYMHGLSESRALYIGSNKNTDEILCERLHYDPVICAEHETRVEQIARSERPPQKNEGWYCSFCNHANVCLNGAFARHNCRTCLHATPAAVGGMDWHCARWEKPLDWNAQQAGCPAHRFIPELVPGEQIDVDGDCVVYRLEDGREWRDGEGGE